MIKTIELIANVEKSIALVGDGTHVRIENCGEGVVYASKYHDIVAKADNVMAIDGGVTKMLTDVCTYGIKDSVGAYRGTVYLLADTDTSVEITTTNNANFKFVRKGGDGGSSNDKFSNFIANTDYTMLLDNNISTVLGDYQETLGIVTQPCDVVLSSKTESVRGKIVASGEDLKYQWLVRENENSIWLITGATTKTDTMTIEKGNYSQFKCEVTDKYNNKVTSDICTVTVLEEE